MSKLFKIVILSLLFTSCLKPQEPIVNEVVELEIINQLDTEEITSIPEEEIENVLPEYDLNISMQGFGFSELPEINIVSDKFAVVGSDTAILYPIVELKDNRDLDKLTDGLLIDRGTIISIEETILIENTIHDNFFKYQGDSNYFYRTEINGVPGLLWGADLVLDIENLEDAKKLNYYYTKDILTKTFLQYNGKNNLTKKNINDLIENKIAFQKIDSKEYVLSSEYPDDMIALYKIDSENRDNSIFITTDLILHSLNLIINKLQIYIEEEYMIPRLKVFIVDFLAHLETLPADDPEIDKVKNYFLLAKLLIEDDNELLSTMPSIVADEYNLIIAADSSALSPILNITEDYKSYFPTSYYNSDKKLKSYFLTVTWLVKINSYINQEKNVNTDLFLKILEIAKNDEGLSISLKELFDPIQYLTPTYMDKIVNKQSILSATTLEDRKWVSSLDVLASLGSKSAISLIKQSESSEDYWNEYLTKLENIQTTIQDKDENFWAKNYKNRYLSLVKTISNFEQSKDFFFTSSGKWNQKVLTTSSAALAEQFTYKTKTESNNDEIIDGVIDQLTYRTSQYPRPINYIEPNISFFYTINKLLAEIKENIDLETISVDHLNNINSFIDICDNIILIVENEIHDRSITKEQNDYIVTIPSVLAKLVVNPENKKGITLINEHFKIPSISNMYIIDKTDEIIKNGIGTPNRLYIALDDNHGGKRISTGYSYTYYEFKEKKEEETNDIIWRNIFYDLNSNTNRWLPFWGKEYLD